ncbi:hypothetical protein [Bacillus sp. WP8]|uniref:hypothetical protein n=1 Tax=Bacillus sp. WP8 TaxID=756828 RepID=UPI001C92F208|nr:hypothetical protein [Bacillus sp. WP8]
MYEVRGEEVRIKFIIAENEEEEEGMGKCGMKKMCKEEGVEIGENMVNGKYRFDIFVIG